MKYFKHRLLFNIILLIVSILVFYNYPSIRKINKTEIDPLISVKDYGFTDIEIYESLLGQSKFDDEIGEAYHLDFHCYDESNSYYVDIMTYKWENQEIAQQYYENEVELARQEYIRRVGEGSYFDSYVPKLPYKKVIEYMVPVSLDEWDVDEGYSTTDVHSEVTSQMSSVFVVLIKDNCVMSIEYTNNFLLDENNIQLFNDLFEEFKAK